MKILSKKLQEIVDEFLRNNVPDEGRHDFIVAAIHFNINLNDCSKYDLMRIDHKAKELANVESNEILTDAAIYSYTLFRAINRKEVPSDKVIDVKMAIMGISTLITEYLTYRIDKEVLNEKLYEELKTLV